MRAFKVNFGGKHTSSWCVNVNFWHVHVRDDKSQTNFGCLQIQIQMCHPKIYGSLTWLQLPSICCHRANLQRWRQCDPPLQRGAPLCWKCHGLCFRWGFWWWCEHQKQPGWCDNEDFDGDVIDLAEYEDMGDIPSTKTASDAMKSKNALPHEGHMRQAPTITQASEAAEDLKKLLRPPQDNSNGYKTVNISEFVKIRMLWMQSLLNLFTHLSSTTHRKWIALSMQAAFALGKGTYCVCQLWRLSKQFIEDCAILPINLFGDWNQSMLLDEDLALDINLYLQTLGKEISALKLVAFLAWPDVCLKHGIMKKISEKTACQYLNVLGYCWRSPKKGQYADGHERDDVVWYQEHRFLPKMKPYEGKSNIGQKKMHQRKAHSWAMKSSSGFTMKSYFTCMIMLEGCGTTKMRQQNLIKKEKVHFSWLPIWYPQTLGGFNHLMERSMHMLWWSQEKTKMDILLVTKLLLKPIQ